MNANHEKLSVRRHGFTISHELHMSYMLYMENSSYPCSFELSPPSFPGNFCWEAIVQFKLNITVNESFKFSRSVRTALGLASSINAWGKWPAVFSQFAPLPEHFFWLKPKLWNYYFKKTRLFLSHIPIKKFLNLKNMIGFWKEKKSRTENFEWNEALYW